MFLFASQGGYPYQDPLAQKAMAVAEQQARVQAIREVHDRETQRLLRGRQELQQQVYGHQVHESTTHCIIHVKILLLVVLYVYFNLIWRAVWFCVNRFCLHQLS